MVSVLKGTKCGESMWIYRVWEQSVGTKCGNSGGERVCMGRVRGKSVDTIQEYVYITRHIHNKLHCT